MIIRPIIPFSQHPLRHTVNSKLLNVSQRSLRNFHIQYNVVREKLPSKPNTLRLRKVAQTPDHLVAIPQSRRACAWARADCPTRHQSLETVVQRRDSAKDCGILCLRSGKLSCRMQLRPRLEFFFPKRLGILTRPRVWFAQYMNSNDAAHAVERYESGMDDQIGLERVPARAA